LIRLRSGTGCGLFGPYVDLPAGRCIARITFEGPSEGRVIMDMSAEVGKIVLASRVVDLGALEGHTVELPAILPRPLSACEVRLHCKPEGRAAHCNEVRADMNSAATFPQLGKAPILAQRCQPIRRPENELARADRDRWPN
jgi:hypothetical protein